MNIKNFLSPILSSKRHASEDNIELKNKYRNPYLKTDINGDKKSYFLEMDVNNNGGNLGSFKLFGGVSYNPNVKKGENQEISKGGEATIYSAKNPDNSILRRVFCVEDVKSIEEFMSIRTKKQQEMLILFQKNNITSYELAIDSKATPIEDKVNSYEIKQYIKRLTPILNKHDICVLNEDIQLYEDFIESFPKLYNDVVMVSYKFKHPHGDINRQNIGYEYTEDKNNANKKMLILKLYDNDQMVNELTVFEDSIYKRFSLPLNMENLQYDNEHIHLVTHDLYALIMVFVSVVDLKITNSLIDMPDDEFELYREVDMQLSLLKKQWTVTKQNLKIMEKKYKNNKNDINNNENQVHTKTFSKDSLNVEVIEKKQSLEVENDKLKEKIDELDKLMKQYRKKYPRIGIRPARYLNRIEQFACVKEVLNQFVINAEEKERFVSFMQKMMVGDGGNTIKITVDDLPLRMSSFITRLWGA